MGNIFDSKSGYANWYRFIIGCESDAHQERQCQRVDDASKVDEQQIESLAGIGCTVAEIAAVSGVSKDTVERNYAALIEKGREHAKCSLRRMQFKSAEAGNITMQIWLGKQLLGQRDRTEQEHTGSVGVQLVHDWPRPKREK